MRDSFMKSVRNFKQAMFESDPKICTLIFVDFKKKKKKTDSISLNREKDHIMTASFFDPFLKKHIIEIEEVK